MLSKNSASSRAIPVKTMLRSVIRNPASPVSWGSNRPGMQAGDELDGWRLFMCQFLFFGSRWFAVVAVWLLSKLGLHKQVANRLLEPWMHMTIVISGTEWKNFFKLRAHPAAQPEFQNLAYKMMRLYESSEPRVLADGDWHMPYITFDDEVSVGAGTSAETILLMASAARCARVSYTKQTARKTLEEDGDLFHRLSRSGHWSPLEHVARASSGAGYNGNFRGWIQYRKEFPGEDGR